MTDAGSSSPERIRSIAVHREDVSNALEATLRSDREVVLRVTPPFSGRMRARLHSVGTEPSTGASGDSESDTGPEPVHLDPSDLVDDIPVYPEVDETAAEHPDADIETRRQRHAEAVESWREHVRNSIVESASLDIDDGTTHEVDVNVLG